MKNFTYDLTMLPSFLPNMVYNANVSFYNEIMEKDGSVTEHEVFLISSDGKLGTRQSMSRRNRKSKSLISTIVDSNIVPTN